MDRSKYRHTAIHIKDSKDRKRAIDFFTKLCPGCNVYDYHGYDVSIDNVLFLSKKMNLCCYENMKEFLRDRFSIKDSTMYDVYDGLPLVFDTESMLEDIEYTLNNLQRYYET